MKKTLAAIALSLASIVALAQSPDYADSKANFAVEKNGGATVAGSGFVDYSTSQTANTFLAAPCAVDGPPTFRLGCASDNFILRQPTSPGTQQPSANLNIDGAGLFGSDVQIGGGPILTGNGATGLILYNSTKTGMGSIRLGGTTSAFAGIFNTGNEFIITSANHTLNSSTVTFDGGVKFTPQASLSSSPTLDTTTSFVWPINATAAARAPALPAATGTGQTYFIVKVDSSINPVTVTTDGTDTIKGKTTYTLGSLYDNITLIDRATGVWGVISAKSSGEVMDCQSGPYSFCFWEEFSGSDSNSVTGINSEHTVTGVTVLNTGTHAETSTRNGSTAQCAGLTTITGANHPGVNNICTGSSTTGGQIIRYGTGSTGAVSSTFDVSRDGWNSEFMVYPFKLSDGTDTYDFRMGFGDAASSGADSQGAWANYTHGTNSGALTLMTKNGGGTTTLNGTCAAIQINTWYKVRVSRIGGHFQMYQDGVLCATSAAAEPDSSHTVGVRALIIKSAGTTPSTWGIDYMAAWGPLAR